MAWKFYDYINISIVSTRLYKSCQIHLEEASFSNFSEDWFREFQSCLDWTAFKIDANLHEDGSLLVPFRALPQFLENKYPDESGLQNYLRYLNNYLENLDDDVKHGHAILVEFED